MDEKVQGLLTIRGVLKRPPVRGWLAKFLKTCHSLKLCFNRQTKPGTFCPELAEDRRPSPAGWSDRFDRVLNRLRKRRTLALKLAFTAVIVENIINGEKPRELLPWHEPDPISLLATIGLMLVLMGTLIRFWARGHFTKGRLFTTGPYALVRHPLYTGSLLVTLGVLFQLNDWMNWVVILPVFGIFHGVAIIFEERSLQKKFGEQWELYRAKSPAIIPSLWNQGLLRQAGRWDWKTYLSTPELMTTLMLLSLPWIIELVIKDFIFEGVLRL